MASPIVVVGDSMLDVDIDGTADRLSPEAPVPVVDTRHVWHRPGGAGLAAMLAARAADEVVLVTAVGNDADAQTLTELLAAAGVQVVALPMAGSTVCKTRIRAHGHPMLRIDKGDGTAAGTDLPADVAGALERAAAVCVADYGRGLTAHPQLRRLITAAAQRIPVVWDPHPRGADPVGGCALVTPNHSEAGAATAAALRTGWDARAVCVTRGAHGAVLDCGDGAPVHIPVPDGHAAAPHQDSCGAGDRFAVAATVELARTGDVRCAVTAAVSAASRFVAAGGASGVSTAAPVHIPVASLAPVISPVASLAPVISPVASLAPEYGAITGDVDSVRDRLLAGGVRTLVATGGCFDLLHTGHVRLLRQARQLGDALVVLVNSDASVRSLKGPGRPVVPDVDRVRVLSALACVDAVVVFEESSPEAVLERLRPQIWVKGGDYADTRLPEAEVVARHGGEVVLLPTVAGYSSTKLIAAARS
ncbi:PfkB family carbohydrate kinase [Mycolicibacterium canariasense]|uniref:PfkB family carbohydrate kinase n=1 Tax=Mycolicibacterium canariasense TaxID=228230 RepID=UPI001F342E73|nr:PfkB family carbohydrate kinase [Mycolicibacterium canariasense]